MYHCDTEIAAHFIAAKFFLGYRYYYLELGMDFRESMCLFLPQYVDLLGKAGCSSTDSGLHPHRDTSTPASSMEGVLYHACVPPQRVQQVVQAKQG